MIKIIGGIKKRTKIQISPDNVRPTSIQKRESIFSIIENHRRKTIFDLLPKNIPRIISIGRLDFMSEGLILLTNNGDFARKLELPSSNILRVYRVCIASNLKGDEIEKICRGVSVNGILYKKIEVIIEKISQKKTWLKFKLREGKNREIRNICRFFNWPILKLIRLQYGSIKLNKEKPGQIKEIDPIPNSFMP